MSMAFPTTGWSAVQMNIGCLLLIRGCQNASNASCRYALLKIRAAATITKPHTPRISQSHAVRDERNVRVTDFGESPCRRGYTASCAAKGTAVALSAEALNCGIYDPAGRSKRS